MATLGAHQCTAVVRSQLSVTSRVARVQSTIIAYGAKIQKQEQNVNFLWFKATFLKINYIFLIKVGMLYKIDYGHFARPPLLQVLPY